MCWKKKEKRKKEKDALNVILRLFFHNLLCEIFQELGSLVDELREEIVYSVSKTGGHLSSSLGVAELTVALHHVFNTPEDKIIWDVGHQV